MSDKYYFITNKYNCYGDVVGRGNFINGKLNGRGCLHTKIGWIKSPHFKDGRVFGLGCVYNDFHEVIFYGIMYNNRMIREHRQYHSFLEEEFCPSLVSFHVNICLLNKGSLRKYF